MGLLQVLVACADIERRASLVDVLSQCDVTPSTAASVSEVRTALRQRSVHLVFCEDGLPQGGFREVLGLTKATGAGVPLVVSSPLGDLNEYMEAMQLGAFDFIAPPYRRVEVESIVNSVREIHLSKRMGGTRRNIQAGAVPQDDDAVA